MTKERIEELLEDFRDPEQDDVQAFHELCEIALEKTAKLSAAEERDRWREPESELPEPIEGPAVSVEFRMLGRGRHLGTREGSFHTGHFWCGGRAFRPAEVLCWRPARPVGELPIPKEET